MNYSGKLYVVKVGGNVVRAEKDILRVCRGINKLLQKDARVILVHGGGPLISEEMKKRGLEPVMIAGVRYTDKKALAVAEEVLREINSRIVNGFNSMENKAASVSAVTVPGYECTLCVKKQALKFYREGKAVEADPGLVGEVSDTDSAYLLNLIGKGLVPVIYPIGKDPSGVRLNVNADTMASGIAVGTRCSEMLAVTDVPGILADVSDPGSVIKSVTTEEAMELIRNGTVSGGMIPKVESCIRAVEAGVPAVRMISGKDMGYLKTLSSNGTLITR